MFKKSALWLYCGVFCVRFWLLKFIGLVACCAGGFFLPQEETFLEGKTLDSRAVNAFNVFSYIIYHQYTSVVSVVFYSDPSAQKHRSS